ncbi:uncharacterized protein PHALS_07817 [Plasmopara halstedii]|uniref:Uncharacterized protein n=1 Tax=Plasmopara halstedii TaxID=4781 RepID=A0A0P1B852_PLAHL|nr:uncharacterized protein PHALS_07817 [Plasmopara halstedii]CEG50090.1 hypothetical protein PHALS_07817 [Plasmopara halstedii]|eukprot:XP_024586459.1 hypothetical protein PHALS_07817 [Plasmopara halstedii]
MGHVFVYTIIQAELKGAVSTNKRVEKQNSRWIYERELYEVKVSSGALSRGDWQHLSQLND